MLEQKTKEITKRIIYRFKSAGMLELNVVFHKAMENNMLEEINDQTKQEILCMLYDFQEQEIWDIILYNKKIPKIQRGINAILEYSK